MDQNRVNVPKKKRTISYEKNYEISFEQNIEVTISTCALFMLHLFCLENLTKSLLFLLLNITFQVNLYTIIKITCIQESVLM